MGILLNGNGQFNQDLNTGYFAVTKEQNNERKWLEGAYRHFADVGPEQLNIKRISELTGLPRTNFYYHFPDTDILIAQLLNIHVDLSKEYEKALQQKLQVFIPDLHRIITSFETGIKFHWQLFKHRSDVRFGYIYNAINSSSAEYILPVLRDYYKLTVSDPALKALWKTLTDSWYSRLDFEDFSAESLAELSDNIMQSILRFNRETAILRQKRS
jgi:AcrR family transcriptional regulator